MDTSQWPQEIIVGKPIEDQIVIRNNNCPKPIIERKIRGQIKDDQGVINCPRCNSINTKFCYYNNYSLTQPRYFCKSCRRYWTEGGSLRNIPVGGGSRKNKRSSPSSNSSTSTPNKILHDHHHLPQNPKPTIIPHSQDLNLSFPPPSHNRHLIASNNNLSKAVVSGGDRVNPIIATSDSTTTRLSSSSDRQVSAMELLTGMASNSRGVNCFVPMPTIVDHHHHPGSVYTAGFPDHLHDHQFKSSLGFSLDGYGVVLPTEASNGGPGRLMQLPFEDLKQGKDQQGDSSTGYWTGMLGGGSW